MYLTKVTSNIVLDSSSVSSIYDISSQIKICFFMSFSKRSYCGGQTMSLLAICRLFRLPWFIKRNTLACFVCLAFVHVGQASSKIVSRNL